MTIHQYNALPDDEQQLALREAVLLADREDENNTIYLFQLDSFYVEVYCHKQFAQFGKYRSFDNIEQLEPYLQNISLTL